MRVIAVCVLLAISVAALKEHEFSDMSDYNFERYVKDFNKKYDPTEYARHSLIFTDNFSEIVRHNTDRSQTYKKGVNKFTDMSQAERKQFMGWNHGMKLSTVVQAEQIAEIPAVENLPKSVDWRNNNPPLITPVKDQGGCGSCWAHACTEQVEVSVAQNGGGLTPLSRQNIVDCTQNPQQCGGTGGCEGATAELGFAYVAGGKGMASEEDYPYTGMDGTCDESIQKSATISAWKVLPSNNYTAVVTACATVGPLAITVSANTWMDYSSGVFTGCGDDWDLDHAVQLVGYGHDNSAQLDYWIVRNSWSSGWGEDGYIRIQKHSDGGSQWCGEDTSPGDGTGCQGGPSEVTVCGSCGLWYDVCYATGGRPIPHNNKPAVHPTVVIETM